MRRPVEITDVDECVCALVLPTIPFVSFPSSASQAEEPFVLLFCSSRSIAGDVAVQFVFFELDVVDRSTKKLRIQSFVVCGVIEFVVCPVPATVSTFRECCPAAPNGAVVSVPL